MCVSMVYWPRCNRLVDGVVCENRSSHGSNRDKFPEPCEDFKARNGANKTTGDSHCPNHETRHVPEQGSPCKQCKRVLDNANKRAQYAAKKKNKAHGAPEAGPSNTYVSRALAPAPEAKGSSQPRTHRPPPPVEIGGWDDYTPSAGTGKGKGKME